MDIKGRYFQPARFRLHLTLHQVGFSDIGLASNFRLAAGRSLKAQRARTLAASWMHAFGNGAWEPSADIYYKRLSGASEHDGTTITLLDADYASSEHIMTGDGRNYGVGFMASKTAGRLTGSVSFAWGRAQRRFPEIGRDWVTAAVEQRMSATPRPITVLAVRLGLMQYGPMPRGAR